MAHIVMLCEVDDPDAWEQKFRTHGEHFRWLGTSAMHFSVDGNEVVLHTEAPDLETFLERQQSAANEEAMKDDGVRRDTVRFWVLDREFSY